LENGAPTAILTLGAAAVATYVEMQTEFNDALPH
jgi:hypothetical protein